MRALWIGLIGAVMATGAQAGGCPINRAVMRLEVRTGQTVYDMPAEHPDWAGREYRVTDARSNISLRSAIPGARPRLMGYDAVLTLEGEGGRVLVGTLHTAGVPAVQGISADVDGMRDLGPLTRKVSAVPEGGYQILGGPLAGMNVVLAHCGGLANRAPT